MAVIPGLSALPSAKIYPEVVVTLLTASLALVGVAFLSSGWQN